MRKTKRLIFEEVMMKQALKHRNFGVKYASYIAVVKAAQQIESKVDDKLDGSNNKEVIGNKSQKGAFADDKQNGVNDGVNGDNARSYYYFVYNR